MRRAFDSNGTNSICVLERTPRDDEAIVDSDGADVALLVIDPLAGALLYVNEAATKLFAIAEDEPTSPQQLLPELADLSPREFRTRIARAPGRELVVRLEPLKAGPFNPAGAILVTIGGAEDRVVSPDGGKRIERLEALWQLVVRRGFAGAEQVRAILREAIRGMGMSSAILARLDENDMVLEFIVDQAELETGQRIPLARSPARDALRRAGTFAILDASAESQYAESAIPGRAFISAAFRVDAEQWVVTLASPAPRGAPFDADDWHYVETLVEALARSIERRESEARIEALAYSDTLTALPNRAAFLERLDETIAECERLGIRAAVLFIDIDGFKAVNDTIGHLGGDNVLAEVARRLRGSLRREEFIGRLGGDEFAIVMTGVKARHQIESIAQRIGSVLTAPFQVDEHRFSLAASIGVAIYPDDATTRDELLAVADSAMYQAKEQGGARIRFREGDWTSEASVGGIAPPAYLSSEPREHSFLLAYQPVVDAHSGRVVAAEALVRRVHPVHGLLAPEHGWSIARDEAGRRDLDRWVLHEAASQAHAWTMAGSDLRVDVNLAAYDPREIETLFSDETLGSDLSRLRIELSATQLASPAPEFQAFIERCLTGGIDFVLDRFDGGFSALQAFANLPVRALKLDRSLVESLPANRTARAMVEGTVVVAKSLGWRVIAKGVETAAQQELLVSLGVDGIQGFFVAHPMTAIDFGIWLREHAGGGLSA